MNGPDPKPKPKPTARPTTPPTRPVLNARVLRSVVPDSVPGATGKWRASPGLTDTLQWISGEQPRVVYEPLSQYWLGATHYAKNKVTMNTAGWVGGYYGDRNGQTVPGADYAENPDDVLAHEFGHVVGRADPRRVPWSMGKAGEGDDSDGYAEAFARAIANYRGLAPADTNRASIRPRDLSHALERGQAEDPRTSDLGRAIYALIGRTPDWTIRR